MSTITFNNLIFTTRGCYNKDMSIKETLYDIAVELSKFTQYPEITIEENGISGTLSRYRYAPFLIEVEGDEINVYLVDKSGDVFGFDNPKQAAKWIAERL